ncbi:sensor domain-containing protein [Kitasatospora sp. NPDC056531]|uniref:sensor domain-containing protein n=1 Tax=Kitasatospora sp. NPDC056531 TaxID=3345856 RepID=UPI0036AC0C25
MNEDPQPVAVRAVLRARPLRFPFTRWVPRCWAHLLCGALLGPLLLVVLAVLLVLGAGLSVVGLGLPLLLARGGRPLRRRPRLPSPAAREPRAEAR